MREVHDTTYIKDSVFVHIRSDTVFVDRIKTMYRERTRVDTVHLTDQVKIAVSHNEVKEVEVNRLMGWQHFLIWSGSIFLILIAAYIAYKSAMAKTPIARWLRKIRQWIAGLLKH